MTQTKMSLAIATLAFWVHVASTLQTEVRFHMYAYYPVNIPWAVPGLPVFYQNGLAVVASYEVANQLDDLIPVQFFLRSVLTPSGKQVTVVAAEVDTAAPVHNAATMNPPFKNATLFRPSQDTASRAVGFLTNTNDLFNVEGLGTQGFIKSEGLFLWASDDGKLQDINNGWWLSRIGDRDLFALNWAGDVKATRDGIQVDMTSEAMW